MSQVTIINNHCCSFKMRRFLVLDVPSPAYTITRPNTQSSMTTTKWPWELIVSYVKCLGEICLNGGKSTIQKDALMGCQGNEAGLLQFLKFQLQLENGMKVNSLLCYLYLWPFDGQ